MKILLLNDNPVVSKLVTLSAQKTSDELDVVVKLEDAQKDAYDLVVVDDTLYSEGLFDELNSTIKYSKSLFICSRDTELVEWFTSTLKKPFLPTDLVELFAQFGKEISSIESDTKELSLSDDETDISLDEELSLSDDETDISLDEELSLSDDETDISDSKDIENSVLDEEEAQEVQNLFDDINNENLEDSLDENDLLEENADEESLDYDLENKETDELLVDSEEEPTDDELLLEENETILEDEQEIEEPLINEIEDSVETEEELFDGELSFEDETDIEEENELEDEISDEDTTDLEESENLLEDEESKEKLAVEETDDLLDENLEQQIEDAVQQLTPEELESEVDEDTILDIVSTDIDSLTTRDLKLAIGEEVEDEAELEVANDELVEEETVVVDTEEESINDEPQEVENSNVEQLKTLLEALSDKNIAASLKGMKISINITLGDE